MKKLFPLVCLLTFAAATYLQAQTITTGSISGSPFCAGSAVSVPYTISGSGSINGGNVFTAQLSNASGSFSNPVNIGTLAATNSSTISATLPANPISGSAYRIRVISSNPAITGSQNSTPLIINAAPPLPTVTATPGTICVGQTANLNGVAPGYNVNWWTASTGGTELTTVASGANYTVSPTATSTYYAQSVFMPSATQTFNYTGGAQMWVVPAGIYSIAVNLYGAQGGSSEFYCCPYVGGSGGEEQGTYAVNPGDTLYIYVGGQGQESESGSPGGFNGGGSGGTGGTIVYYAAGGGGASDLRKGGTALSNRIFVAGGGGGATTVGNGGSGGVSLSSGTLGQGANGGLFGGTYQGEGGGGGGYYGGSANFQGGTGGSSYADPSATGVTSSTGVRTGNGQIIITYTQTLSCASAQRAPVTVKVNPLPVVTPTATPPVLCSGSQVTLTGAGAKTYLWNNGAANGVAFSIANTTSYTVTGTDSNGCNNTATVTVNVNPLPLVSANATSQAMCTGGATALNGVGAVSYVWNNGVTDGVPFYPANTGTYSVTGTDGNSCQNTATITVVVEALPAALTVAPPGVICSGQTALILDTLPTGNNVNLWTAATGGTELGTIQNDSSFGVAPAVTTTYYAETDLVSPVIFSQTFGYTGSQIAWTVPAGITSISVDVQGAAGGSDEGQGAVGGRIQGSYPVTPGQTIYITVGQQGSDGYGEGVGGAGGFNGGGAGAPENFEGEEEFGAGGGGGASDIRMGGTALSNRIFVAGGGGGGGYMFSYSYVIGGGGTGGGLTGGNGTATDVPSYFAGFGGTQSYGGASECQLGSLGQGGAGCNSAGGGGGYYGGGGGYEGGGGGGGSNYSDAAATGVINTQGYQRGNGQVIISYAFPLSCVSTTRTPVTVSVNPNPPAPVIGTTGETAFCIGGTVALNVTNAPALPDSQLQWYFNNNAIPGSDTDTYYAGTLGSYTCTNTVLGCTTVSNTIAVTVNPLPIITASATSDTVCAGIPVTINGAGAVSYAWSNGVINGVAFIPTNGTTYTVTGTDANACSNTATISITVSPAPVIVANGPVNICNGGYVSLSIANDSLFPQSALQWYFNNDLIPGEHAATYLTGVTGSYTCVFTSPVGCTSTSNAIVVGATSSPVAAISGTASACGSVSLTASGGTTYTWSGGSNPNSAINTFTTSGTYTVTVSNGSGCSATASQLVTIYPGPAAGITGTASACSLVSLTATGGTTYTWNGGSSPNTAANTFNTSGNYTVVVSNSSGCSVTASQLVTVYPSVTAGITGNASTCDSVSLTAIGGTTYSWNGGNSPNTAANTFNTSGTYSVVVSNSSGCSATASQLVTVYPSVTAGITGTASACNSVSLTASGGTTYVWNGGSSPNMADNTFTSTGTYSVVVSNSNGCSATASQLVTIYPAVTAGITGTAAACSLVSLTATGGTTYVWNGGSSPNTADNTFNTSGTYSVVVSNSNGCSATASQLVSVYPSVTAGITGTATACSSVSLSATGGTTYSWNGGNSPNTTDNTFNTSGTYTVIVSSSTGCSATASQLVTVLPGVTAGITGTASACSSVSLTAAGGTTYVWNGGSSPNTAGNTFNTSGTYSVVVSNSNGCSATATQLVTIYPAVTAGITGTASGCNPVSLTATGGTTYAWNGGNSPNTAANSFNASGTYSVVVSNSNGCSATASQLVTVLPGVTAGITGTASACSSVSLTATGGTTYSWNGGSSPNTAGNTFNTSGTYTVVVSNSNGCSATASQLVTVYPAVTAHITGTASACGSVSLTASSGTTYSWNGGSSPNSAANTFNTSGTYTVTVSNGNACSATASQLVTVLPGVTAGITGSASACRTVSLTGTGGSTYHWSGGTSVNTAANTFSTSGTYTLTVSNSSGCSATASVPVTVYGIPVATISGTTTACGSVTLTASGGLTYAWSGGNSINSATNTFTSSGTYRVTVSNDGGVCTATASKVVTVNANPVAGITGSTTGCGTVSLTATGGGTYAWSGGHSTHSANNSFTTGGTYTVTVTGGNGCTASASKSVTVNAVPVVGITGVTSACGPVTLTATGGGTYQWSSGSSTNTATNTFSSNGNYRVTVTSAAACSASASASVITNLIPSTPGSITGTTAACLTETSQVYSINTVTGATSYTWTITGGATFVGSASGASVTVNYSSSSIGNVTLKVKANDNCGSSGTTSLNINVKRTCSTKDDIGSDEDNSKTPAAASESELSANFRAYPNPTSGQVKVEFGVTVRESYSFRIYDILGNNISNEAYVAEEGDNAKTIDFSHLSKGIYFIKISSESVEAKTLRIVVQ